MSNQDSVQDVTGASVSVTRRSFMGASLGVAAAASFGSMLTPRASMAAAKPEAARLDPKLFPQGRNINADSNVGVVDTDCGKLRGYNSRGIYTYKGIPYGADTGGANRFTVAKSPQPWPGVRPCLAYGRTCPQAFRTGWNEPENAWMFHWSDGVAGEDCLRLNVWTPSIAGNTKRPVMFWIHGGGYTAGSAEEQIGYDGENLARRGDVVVVSVNHRLNVLGFLNLESHGEQFRHSANVSQLDLVAALQWVKTNIAAFGGDPAQVTIFGQSGGGGKVAYLMGMPSAQGLFQRAIIESGSQPLNLPASTSAKLSDAVLEELQIAPARIAEVQAVPYDKLLAASNRAAARMRGPAGSAAGLRRSGAGFGWQPVVDGDVIPTNAFYPKAPDMSKNVPVLIGSTLNEFLHATDHPEYEQLTWAELATRVDAALPGKGKQAIDIYRADSPKANAFDIWSQMNATTAMRRNAHDIALQKAAQGGAAYAYQFRWKTPVLDGRPRAFHCSEIAFAFDNTDLARTMTGGGDDARALAAKVSDAWIAFAKTGNPNHAGLPKWDAVKGSTSPLMYFDNTCEVKINPDEEELRITA